MGKFIELISKFEGIIGTLLGVVSTLITTQLVKKLGKVYFYFIDWESTFHANKDGYYNITTCS